MDVMPDGMCRWDVLEYAEMLSRIDAIRADPEYDDKMRDWLDAHPNSTAAEEYAELDRLYAERIASCAARRRADGKRLTREDGMSETTFTPGPWEVGPDPTGEDTWNYLQISAGEGCYDDDTNRGFMIATWINPADAHLLAAAPEMFVALNQAREFIVYVLGSVRPKPMLAAIDAALAKATQEGAR